MAKVKEYKFDVGELHKEIDIAFEELEQEGAFKKQVSANKQYQKGSGFAKELAQKAVNRRYQKGK